MSHYSTRWLLTGCAVFALEAGSAYAQTIDYGGLQDLFGEPVTTSATGKPQKASDVPVAMDIITAEDIRRSGAQNIPQILSSHVPGIVNWQQTRSWSDVGIRGQNGPLNPTLLVLVNGREVYLDTYGYTDWSLIPVQLEEIRQIEVVKGANTALFGFNAASGVINIVTYNPKYDKVSEAGVTVGTGEYGKLQGVQTMQLSDAVNVRVSGDVNGMSEWDRNSKTPYASDLRFQGSDRVGHFNLDSLAQLSDKTQLRLEGSHVQGDMNDALNFSNVTAVKRTNSAKATVTSQTDYGLVEGSLYQNLLTWIPVAGAGSLATHNTITVAQLQDLFKVGDNHSFRVLGEYRYNHVAGEVTGDAADFSYNQGAISGMWNWAITPQWELTNALRLDALQYNRSGLAPSVPFSSNDDFAKAHTTLGANSGLVWKATDLDTLKLSYARGVVVPSLFAAGGYKELPGMVAAGDPRLSPTIVDDYEFGYDRQIAAIDGKFRSSFYYKHSDNIFAAVSSLYISGSTSVLQAANFGSSDTQGVEFQLSGKIHQAWRWDLGYSFQTTDDNFRNTGLATLPIKYEDTIPHHIVNAHLGWTNGPWEVDGYAQVTSAFKSLGAPVELSYNVNNMDAYQTLTTRVGYKLENGIQLAVTAADLNQQRIATNPGLEENREVYFSVSKQF